MRVLLSALTWLAATAAPGAMTFAEIATETAAVVGADTGRSLCFPDIAGEAEVHVIAIYESEDRVDGTIPRLGRAFVTVGPTDSPALIVLSAYDPVVWQVTMEPGAKIAGVMLLGYTEPFVVGLPEGTSVSRSAYETLDDERAPPCGSIADAEAASAMREEALQLERIIRRGERDVQEIETTTAAYAAFFDALVAAGLDEDGLMIARGVAGEQSRKFVEARAEQAELERRRDAVTRQLERGDATGIPDYLMSYFSSDGRPFEVVPQSRIERITAAFEEVGPFAIASFQEAYDAEDHGAFEISARTANRSAEKRAAASARLAALARPELPLKPADAPVLVAPVELEGQRAFSWLAERGYVEAGGAMEAYICQLTELRAEALGGSVPPCERQYGHRPIYTILGPIWWPDGLCGAGSVNVILPTGVPEPKGDPCHSRLAHEAELFARP